MKKIFTSRVQIILAIAFIAAALTVGSILLWPGKASFLNNSVGTIMTPLKNGVNILVDKAESIYDYIFSYEELKAENEQLREEMAERNEDIRNAQTYKEENERLREALDLADKHTDYTLEIANVVSWGGNGYGSTMTISKGEAAGLQTGMCAITESGQLVGLVTQTGNNWATITTILDTDSEVGAYIFGSGYTCIAQGSFDQINQGRLLASYLNSSATIRNSDQVLTSGDGDIYPAGLVIGTVVDVGDDETAVAKYAVLEPTVDITSIEQVFIIKSFSTND